VSASPGPVAATWLGHATALIEVGDARFLTDPVLTRRIGHLMRHAPVPPLPDPLDAILLSHAHRDHLDRRTLRKIDPAVPIVVPAGIDPVVHRLGREVIEVPVGEATEIGGVRVEALPVDHDPRRAPWSKPGAAAGFLVGDDDASVWFPGDTDLHDRLWELEGRVSLALMPVWGWGPSLGAGHMDPERAASAVAIVQPRVAVPIHWGTYLPFGLGTTHGRLLRTPALDFAQRAGQRTPEVAVEVLAVGGRTEVLPAS
jgi:L-ascorbate metabolism protein UlaG (beta-lactamase superfamily)